MRDSKLPRSHMKNTLGKPQKDQDVRWVLSGLCTSVQIKINHIFFNIKVKRKVSKSCTAGHMIYMETGAVDFLILTKWLGIRSYQFFKHSMKDLNLLVFPIYKDWCLIPLKYRLGWIPRALRPDNRDESCVSSIMPLSLINKCINIIHRDRWTNEF